MVDHGTLHPRSNRIACEPRGLRNVSRGFTEFHSLAITAVTYKLQRAQATAKRCEEI
jgi:hypothetical protein